MNKTAVIILAAGHGKRMQSELPKALVSLNGKPLISHVIDAVRASGLTNDPIIVVGQKREKVMEMLGDSYRYAVQEEQLGTGHAVLSAKEFLTTDTTGVVVLYVDHPFVSPETIRALAETREKNSAKIAMATVSLPDFHEWRTAFLGFGRVKRDVDGKIIGIVEAKDATEEEKNILEVNPAYFSFDQKWLLEALPKLKNANAQGEYYLVDLVKMAFEEGLEIPTISITPREAIGTNSKEDVGIAEGI
ncbi:MAG: NTP transferase domain-containing protein [Candidatus Pacebacteria bacterium]|nr:NTP transferase domain-containing protein [Candidatus Paceibacterota bacterium]